MKRRLHQSDSRGIPFAGAIHNRLHQLSPDAPVLRGGIELVLGEASRIVRMERGVIVAETRHGFVCANAGVDVSNASEGTAILLPDDAVRNLIRQGKVEQIYSVNPALFPFRVEIAVANSTSPALRPRGRAAIKSGRDSASGTLANRLLDIGLIAILEAESACV